MLYFVGIFLGEYDISPTKKTVCNFIFDFFNITDKIKSSMIK